MLIWPIARRGSLLIFFFPPAFSKLQLFLYCWVAIFKEDLACARSVPQTSRKQPPKGSEDGINIAVLKRQQGIPLYPHQEDVQPPAAGREAKLTAVCQDRLALVAVAAIWLQNTSKLDWPAAFLTAGGNNRT